MKFLLFIGILLFSTSVLALEIPETQLNKKVYLEIDGKIKYETEESLALGFNILKRADYTREIKLSVDGNKNLFTINVKYNNGSFIKYSIDKNNILRKVSIYNANIRRQEIYEGKKLGPTINAIMLNVGLVFVSTEYKAKKEAEEKIKENISKNIMNFDLHMPLFAGLKWNDNVYTAIKKLSQAKGVNNIELIIDGCDKNGLDEKYLIEYFSRNYGPYDDAFWGDIYSCSQNVTTCNDNLLKKLSETTSCNLAIFAHINIANTDCILRVSISSRGSQPSNTITEIKINGDFSYSDQIELERLYNLHSRFIVTRQEALHP